MNVSIEAKTILLNEGIAALLESMKNDYATNFRDRLATDASNTETRNRIRNDMYEKYCATLTFEEGRNYIKIITNRSVAGFICKKDNPKKGFKIGDMLKAASWSAPATNFIRGSVFNETDIKRVAWTGIQ
jgi:hypothetical protein